jgi:acetamidase/formamidase
MCKTILFSLICSLGFAQVTTPATSQLSGQKYVLDATPKTVAFGYYDAAAKPVLHIHSGDTVEFHTVITNSPEGLEKGGVAPDQIEEKLRDIFREVTNRGPGGHVLNGPVFIEEAEPGDTLEVRIERIDLAIPYAYNAFGPNRGFLPEDFPYRKIKIIPLNRERMVADFTPGIEIPLRPFFGSMGVAPPESYGRIDSAPPGIHAGNMDNKELIAGSTLYVPVHARGALFEIGDGHAGQGNGEVDITALETSLVGTLQFLVHKDTKQKYPRAETPTHYISMGFHHELYPATKIAVREMVDFLMSEKHLSHDEAYMLTSVAGDVSITELVDGNVGVHVMLPKSIFIPH